MGDNKEGCRVKRKFRHSRTKPAFLIGGVAGVFVREIVTFSSEHGLQTPVYRLCILVCIMENRVTANIKVIKPQISRFILGAATERSNREASIQCKFILGDAWVNPQRPGRGLIDGLYK